ncbi:hypothetical protein [Maribellus maritimus]|uniref:hypothetical protein n=1 Tax=Maribellus maritimus TaxID=2870838 RepID=UPI001EECC1BF|nr:hypothetical protein [Maribellus maritimus]MCG6189627.1 hypothetical protein [Maribellus maritimus]
MNAKINLFVLVLSVLTFFSCQEESEPKPLPDPSYPTTYKPLSQSEWAERNDDFQKINIYGGLILNEYGFAEGEIPLINVDSITKDLVTNKIDTLVSMYHEFLGIPEEMTFDYENQIQILATNSIPRATKVGIRSFYEGMENAKEKGYFEDYMRDIRYKFYLTENQFDEKILDGVEISFDFNINKSSIKIQGNWLSKIVVPKDKIYSEGDALGIAYREILKQTGRNIWESKENYSSYSLLLKIKNNNQFEIRDCWIVYTVEIPYAGYTIAVYIDTQTGEVVKYFDRL